MKVALIQLTSVLDYKKNLTKIDAFIKKAMKTDKVEAIFLPEVFYSMSNGQVPTPHLVSQNNVHYNNIKNLAKENGVYLIGGSVAFSKRGKIYNRALNFSPDGKSLGAYNKRKLFALNLKGRDKTNLDEGKIYSAGDKLKTLKLGNFKVGISICFDLRFPEIYREYFKRKVDILTVASAFTVPTGKAHWKTLLRARAIENQAYVIAANQWGKHNEKIKTYGHSMIIDPLGEILAELPEGEGYICADLSTKRLNSVRERMKVDPIT